MAACVDENGEKTWYRALRLPNDMFAFVDNGTVVKHSDVIRLIACPQKFCNIPIFSCVFKPVRSSFEVGIYSSINFFYNFPVCKWCFIIIFIYLFWQITDYKCKIYENSEDNCTIKKVGETEPIGSLCDWSVIFRNRKQPEESQNWENKENHDVIQSMYRFF